MPMTRTIIAALVALVVSGSAWADSYTLNCVISYTVDLLVEEGTSDQTGPTKGEDHLFVIEDGKGIVSFNGPVCSELTDYKMTDEKYFIECSNQISEFIWKETHTINRYTGAYNNLVTHNKGGLMHTGKCNKVEQQF